MGLDCFINSGCNSTKNVNNNKTLPKMTGVNLGSGYDSLTGIKLCNSSQTKVYSGMKIYPPKPQDDKFF